MDFSWETCGTKEFPGSFLVCWKFHFSSPGFWFALLHFSLRLMVVDIVRGLRFVVFMFTCNSSLLLFARCGGFPLRSTTLIYICNAHARLVHYLSHLSAAFTWITLSSFTGENFMLLPAAFAFLGSSLVHSSFPLLFPWRRHPLL